MRTVLACCFVVTATSLLACGGGDGSGNDSEDATEASSPQFICPNGIGTSDRTFVKLVGDEVTVTVEGVGVQTGKEVAGAKNGAQAFSHWVGKGEFAKTDVLTLSKSMMGGKAGTVDLTEPNVNPKFESSCKRATKAQLAEDQCLPQLVASSFIDTDTMTEAGSNKASKISSTRYEVTISDAKVGNLVWDAAVTSKGLFCKVNTLTAKSCPAIVADKAFSRAVADGSSSGSPFVQKLAKDTYKAGVYDVESGDFVYQIVTSSESDGCSIKSVTPVNQ